MSTPAKNITDLTGHVAVVIGATSGLGRAIAIGLAESGADVIPTGRRVEMAQEVAHAVEKAGRRSLVHAVDVSNRDSIQSLCNAVLDEFGQVDILVNAAGRTLRKQTKDVNEQEWATVMDTNLLGLLRACQVFHGPLKQSGRGRVINLASLAAHVAFHNVGVYNASKAAVMSLTQTLCIEWAADHITVNALVPGMFPTEINASVLQGTERSRELLSRTPMKRFGRHDELVGAAVFLASDAASFISGHGLAVDGGFLASGVNS